MWLLLAVFAVVPDLKSDVQIDRPVPQLLTGRNFQAALKSTVELRWQKADLRFITRQITSQLKLGIVIDRRVDPSPKPDIHVKNKTLLEGLQMIAAKGNARISLVGNTVFFRPVKGNGKDRSPKTDPLLQLLRQRETDWKSVRRKLSARRRLSLGSSRTLHWNDLDQPRNIVKNIGELYRLTMSGLEKIPHDLWAGATMPKATLIEQLTVILFQYDLTFRWSARGDGIEIVPLVGSTKTTR